MNKLKMQTRLKRLSHSVFPLDVYFPRGTWWGPTLNGSKNNVKRAVAETETGSRLST